MGPRAPGGHDAGICDQRLVTHDVQAAVYAVNVPGPEPVLYDSARSAGSLNLTGWSDPRVDAALDRARVTTDAAVRVAAYQEVSRLVAAEVPLWLCQGTATAFSGKDHTDLTLVNDGSVLFDRYGTR